jgi:hypothetical protein
MVSITTRFVTIIVTMVMISGFCNDDNIDCFSYTVKYIFNEQSNGFEVQL